LSAGGDDGEVAAGGVGHGARVAVDLSGGVVSRAAASLATV
jgi:hypothetical protein